MSKIRQSKYKVGRRLGASLWGAAKDPFKKKNYAPGQHGRSFSKAPSGYAAQLSAKQRLRFYYNIVERQFRNIVRLSMKLKGDTGENMIGLLESRLDTIVFRSGFAPTIFASAQLISHRHLTVNGKIASFKSMRVKPGDIISLTDNAKNMQIIKESLSASTRIVPDYLEVDKDNYIVKFLRKPLFSEVPYESTMNPQLIVEYYAS